MSSFSFSWDPTSRSVDGCPAAWSSSDIDSRSQKVTHRCDPFELCVGDQAWLPSPSEALWCLQLHLWNLLLGWSWLWERWWMSGPVLVVDRLSLSIHFSNMEATTSAHWWASLALASSHSPKVTSLSLWEALSQWWDGWVPAGSGSPLPSNWSPLLHCRGSFKEDKMSLVISHTHLGPHSGGPGNLYGMYTWWKRSPISSLEVQYPTSWMAGTSALGSSLGRPHWWPWQINLSTSFCPDSAASTNILLRMNGWCGALTSHQGYSCRKNSMSRWCSASQMDRPSFFAHSLAPRVLCHLSWYCNSSRAW